MNITLKISTVNLKNRLPQEVRAFSAEELQEFITQGTVIKKKKQYLLIIHHRQFTLQCPILRMDDGSYQMIWPSFKLPNRSYPVFVYLYAVAWYLSSGESMRSTAQKVIKVFGLTTFSHSTLCRFLPKLYPILPYLIQYGAQIINDWGSTTSRVVPRKHWDKLKCVLAEQLIGLLEPVLRVPPEFGSWFAYQYFTDTDRFLV
ncbi:hypothetical protein [Desulfosporosinus sp. BICA1-9]|uniref:hypothetical protein n=2 Tax=Desulfosporosinus sp. BICA1-9 TaxID=1531958 RepID=UPI0025C39C80|nr:hypothetical protein [Desulfosporosinus sp. BICA1-9]